MSELAGPKKRAQDREKRKKQLQQKALRALKKYQPKLFHPEPVAEDFEHNWDNVRDELLKKLGARGEYPSAVNYLSSELHKLAKEHQLEIKLPTVPVSIKRTRPMRTLYWQEQANQQIYAHQLWMETLKKSPNSLDGDNLYTAIICSAIYHSGLCTPDEVLGFTQILDATRPLNRWGDMMYVEFEVNSRLFNTNVYQDDDKKITLRRLYLSPLTLSLLNLARKRRQNGEQWRPPKTVTSCWSLIRHYMSQFGDIPDTFRRFCKSAVAVTEFGVGLVLPQVLLEYAVGRNHSYSLPVNNQRRLLTPNIRPLSPVSAKDLLGAVPLALPQQKLVRKRGRNFGIYKQLLDASRENDEKGHKRSKADANGALAGLLDAGLEEHEFRLVHWLMTVSMKNEVSTVRRYTEAVAKGWLAYSAEQELDEMSADDYYEWYSQLIDMSTTIESKQFNAGRYQQFHQHCAAYFSAPVLEDALPYAKDSDLRHHTRAGFIDETLFHALLLSIENFTDFTEQDKLQYQCIAILAYRCGLRLGEILKLQIKDIEKSEIAWVTVRENKYGNNKSNAAYRRVPLIPLLVQHPQKGQFPSLSEYAKISTFLRNRRTRAGKNNMLLFFQPGSYGMKLAQSNVSRVMKTLLVHLSGLGHYVEHHFRHSCLSRLQFMMHVDDLETEITSGALTEILPYGPDKCREIMGLIATENKRDRYWAIASFAGHSSPETTFSNYFHFSDMIFGYLVNQRNDLYSQEFLHNVSGISKQKLKNRAMNNKDIELTKIIPPLLSEVKKWVKPPLKLEEYKATGLKIEKQRISMDTCYQVLQCYELGISPQEFLYVYQIEEKLLEKWLRNACYIRDLKTSNENSRFNSKERAHKLLPAPLNSRDEKRYVGRFIEAIRKVYPVNKAELKWAFEYCLNHHAVEHGIYFNKPEELQQFIVAFGTSIPKLHWRIATRALEHHDNSSAWENVLKKLRLNRQVVSSKKGRTGHGGVYLKLANPKKTKETSPLLSYMLRMAMIMMMEIK